MKNAVVIGYGMVGQATCHALGIKDYYSRSKATVKLEDIPKFKYIFICLPTPTVNGSQDISRIRQYFELFGKEAKDNVFIIRSTVLPGVCRDLADHYGVKVAHVPEFLTEATWKADSEWPDIVVVGADCDRLRAEVAAIFRSRFKGANFFLTDTVTSELTKYAINCLYALKVVYANQLYDFAKSIGANYETVKNACYARKWVGANHLRIFDKEGKRGAGGKCLLKDLDAFSVHSMSFLLTVANELNKKYINESHPKTD